MSFLASGILVALLIGPVASAQAAPQTGIPAGTIISGATSSSYTTSFTKRGTNTFYVEVWNACNATHVRSNTVTITVN